MGGQHGNIAHSSATGFFNPMLGGVASSDFFGGGVLGGASAFDLVGDEVENCCLYFGRKWLCCDDTAVTLNPGWRGFILAKVDHSSQSDPTLSVEQVAAASIDGMPSAAKSTPSVTYRALYFVGGDGVVDLRGAPQIPAYLP